MRYLSFIAIITFFSCHNVSQNGAPAGSTVRTGVTDGTPEQQARLQRTMAYLRLHQIPFNKNASARFVDQEADVEIQKTDKVVQRVYALCFICLKSRGLSDDMQAKLAQKWHIMDRLTPLERKYVLAAHPTSQQKADANWQYEDLHVLLWALGFVDSLDYPDHRCKAADDTKILRDLSESEFRQKAILRTNKEILDQTDLIYILDWICVDARTTKSPAPAGLNGRVVFERHYALNWLIRYEGMDWDEISTDT